MLTIAISAVVITICSGYIGISNPMIYADAENYCINQFHSHLATITSEADNIEVYNTAPTDLDMWKWIGLSDLNSDELYVWSDGSTLAYENWGVGEPNNDAPWANQRCTAMVGSRGSCPGCEASTWKNAPCNEPHALLCNDMVLSCVVSNNTYKVDWNALLPPDVKIHKFSIDRNELSLKIDIELSYLEYSVADNEEGYGITYWLDFQSFNGNNMNQVYNPGACGNRKQSSYYNNGTLRDFHEWWVFSETPYIYDNIANDKYLAYPDPGNFWNLRVKDGTFVDKCSRIRYNASFTWDDLLNCDGIGNTINVNEDSEYINMSGIFYIYLVSPLSKNYDSGFYRTYQLVSEPFEISLIKSNHMLSSVHLNLFDISLFNVFTEDVEGHFRVSVITESAHYIYLEKATLISYPLQLLDTGVDKYALTDAVSISCISDVNNICRQIFQINIEFNNGYCNNNTDSKFNLTGSYSLRFEIHCNNDSNTTDCTQYVNKYGSSPILSFYLSFIDYTCFVTKVGNITYDLDMKLYHQNWSSTSPILYEPGIDIIYVEIEAYNLPQNVFNSVSLSLVNVWICQYDDNLGDLPDPKHNILGGCLANSLYAFSLYYHIFPTLSHETVVYDEDISNIIRFSFKVPKDSSNENRDKLFIHSEVEISFNHQNTSRRLLLPTNYYSHEYIQIGDYIELKSNHPNYDQEKDHDNIVTTTKNDEGDADTAYRDFTSIIAFLFVRVYFV